MEIPLKSKPKVSTVDLFDDYKRSHPPGVDSQGNTPPTPPSASGRRPSTQKSVLSSQLAQARTLRNANPAGHVISEPRATHMDVSYSTPVDPSQDVKVEFGKYKLARTFSEAEIGHKFPLNGSNETLQPPAGRELSKTPLSPSDDDHIVYGIGGHGRGDLGFEDEYIPGLDFGDMVGRWTAKNTAHKRYMGESTGLALRPASSNSSAPISREESFLDLNTLHAKVAPQPINTRGPINGSHYSFTKLSDTMKLRTPQSGSVVNNEDFLRFDVAAKSARPTTDNISPNHSAEFLAGEHQNKKQRPLQDEAAQTEVNYEAILSSLPTNFNDLPYSQRKKVVTSLSGSVDFSQFSLFAKNYCNDKYGSSSSVGSRRTSKSTTGTISQNGSFVRRSRRGSMNTVASRLLALSSVTDMSKIGLPEPKHDVDETGAIVMNHVLGKVIGFGAWGIIRECKAPDGNIMAMKIVKSNRPTVDSKDGQSPKSASPDSCQHYNPKVLNVFRKEIDIWKRLHHPNLLELHLYHETDSAIFCVMNRIYGGTLFEVVSKRGLYDAGTLSCPITFSLENQEHRLADVVSCAKQIVGALQYLHFEMGVVHGDLKLENVLVEEQTRQLCESSHDSPFLKMYLCDFGMSRVYSSRLSRNTSMKRSTTGDGEYDKRSKSSFTQKRRPLYNGDASLKLELASPEDPSLNFTAELDDAIRRNIRKVRLRDKDCPSYPSSYSQDDLVIGTGFFAKRVGPLMQSVRITPNHSQTSLSDIPTFEHTKRSLETGIYKFPERSAVNADLPHSHIGSLPYAAPELLTPSPPPLGPLADIWAFGVLLFAMCVGKLPFQHPSESRLRAIISAGLYLHADLRNACLLRWIMENEEEKSLQSSHSAAGLSMSVMEGGDLLGNMDHERSAQLDALHKEWLHYSQQKGDKFKGLYDIIAGSLESNITKRWDLDMIWSRLESTAP